MARSFKSRVIELRFRIAQMTGVSDGAVSGNDRIKIVKNVAVSVCIDKAGYIVGSSATITVWNMRREDMAELTVVFSENSAVFKHSVEVWAGDEDLNGTRNLSLVFWGDIAQAWAEFSSQPDVSFHIRAMTTYFASRIDGGPESFQSDTPVSVLIQRYGGLLGKAVNIAPGVGNIIVRKGTVLNGSLIEKLQTIERSYRIHMICDERGLWAGTSKDVRATESVPIWSKDTGMIGYPSLSYNMITAKALFDPTVMALGYIQIKSGLPNASGKFKVVNVSHYIENLLPSSKWETSVRVLIANI